MRSFVSLRLGVRRLAFLAIPVLAVSSVAASVFLISALPVRAETKIFFVENQPDDYGIDQCLSSGAKCGKPMASAYCQSRQYDGAISFHKAEPEEMPNKTGGDACRASGCVEFVAIECER